MSRVRRPLSLVSPTPLSLRTSLARVTRPSPPSSHALTFARSKRKRDREKKEGKTGGKWIGNLFKENRGNGESVCVAHTRYGRVSMISEGVPRDIPGCFQTGFCQVRVISNNGRNMFDLIIAGSYVQLYFEEYNWKSRKFLGKLFQRTKYKKVLYFKYFVYFFYIVYIHVKTHSFNSNCLLARLTVNR